MPFVSKQVTFVTRNGVPSLFNFAAAEYITVVKTTNKLALKGDSTIPTELTKKAFVAAHCATNEIKAEIKLRGSSVGAKSLIEQAALAPKHQIFVIMKFGDESLDSAYQGVIKPIGADFGFDVIRVDEIQDSGSISQQILQNIAESAVVLADLTGERPNCYYEAGFAHAMGKELILSVKHDSKVHFDLAGYRFISWRTESDYRNKLRDRLESIAEKRSA